MTVIATLLSGALLIPAALHLLWAIGFWFPIKDETALARATVGAKGITRMPPAIPCAVVAMALLFAAILPHVPAFPLQSLMMSGAAAVFLLRGLIAYTPFWRKHFCEEPFASLDRRFFSPLILAMGVAFLILRLQGT
ncbi:uncharacterized protein DUF3995 [Shimia isoporae]|uniref:Uncharacterized protein DUF3995 n=1 Tax=Shimia isoporae TaxID=647720 RepID=A0A4R1N9F0_9RHOB|nr:DUF3995 domain-containing protein [Shimia isoporae]TCL00412.1 uncharacterized protein DUF3995 [Shimia isoporae]